MPLDKPAFDAIIQLLLPHTTSRADREALVNTALYGCGVLRQINWDGNAQAFTVRLVNLLERYGTCAPGQPALAMLLAELKKQTGTDKHAEIDRLIALVVGPGSSPADGSPPPDTAGSGTGIAVNQPVENLNSGQVIGSVQGNVSITHNYGNSSGGPAEASPNQGANSGNTNPGNDATLLLFVCFAPVDNYLTNTITEMIDQGGYQTWRADKTLPGMDIQAVQDQRIRQALAFIYILTPDSLVAPDCQRQFKLALQLAKPIMPILLRKDLDLPPEISRYHPADFSDGPTPAGIARLMGGLSTFSQRH